MSNGNKTVADRRQYVVKANDLIRKTRYDLTTQQQKIILFCISKIKPDDLPETEYEIDINDICDACGINIDYGGYYYKTIKDDLQALTHRLWVKMPDKSEQTVSWIGDAKIIPLSGKVYITFHKAMSPYLFELKERYTQYHLEDVLVFKGKYTIRLYEILRSYTTQRAIDEGWERNASFKIDELRELLSVDGYKRWADFDKYIVKKAVDEINLCNDEIHIEYETYKNGGRNVESINFIITSARARQMLYAHQERRERLNSSRKKNKKRQQTTTAAAAGISSSSSASAGDDQGGRGRDQSGGGDQQQREREELAEQMKKAEDMLKEFEKKYSAISGAKPEQDIAAEMRKQLERLKEMSKRLEIVENTISSSGGGDQEQE